MKAVQIDLQMSIVELAQGGLSQVLRALENSNEESKPKFHVIPPLRTPHSLHKQLEWVPVMHDGPVSITTPQELSTLQDVLSFWVCRKDINN